MDINTTLLNHLASGAGAASFLRMKCPNVVRLAQAFFEARTDIGRLKMAQDVAEEILLKNDLRDLIEIRDIVAKQELRRQIRYGKQQDYTAHTVYLYFLGLWLYDNLPQIAVAVGTKSGIADDNERDKYFLLQWTYASLHDIGYAFHNLEPDTQKDRNLIDSVFTWEWVKKQYASISASAESTLRKAHEVWNSKYALSMPPGTASYAAGSNVEVLNRLASAPWLKDLLPRFEGIDLFDALDETSRLKEYALEVAQKGYGGKGPCVDHTVASGLFLLQYTSFWYWLMSHIQATSSVKTYMQISEGFNYAAENLITDFIPACRAVAFHNVQPKTKASGKIIPMLTLRAEPITFLAILADELQRWDRSPAGWMHLNEYRVFSESALESKDVEIFAMGPRNQPTAVFAMNVKGRASRDELNTFRQTLRDRLPDYSDVLGVQTRPSD